MSFRLRAFVWHLSGSFFLALSALIVVFLIWYPWPLSEATGVTNIFLLLLGVDVVLGPLLTLIVAKPFKKSLKLDLSVIIMLQFTAFFYGVWIVEQGRPIWLVFNGDRFDLVQVYERDNPYLQKAPIEYQQRNWFGPEYVAARQPKGTEERNNLTFEALFAGIDLPQRPDLYLPYHEEIQNVIASSHLLSELQKYNHPADIELVLKKWPQATAYLPLMSRAKAMTVLINHAGEIVAVVNLNPWE